MGCVTFVGDLRKVTLNGAMTLAVGELVIIVGRKTKTNNWDDDMSIDPGEEGVMLKVLGRKGISHAWEHLLDQWSESVFHECG